MDSQELRSLLARIRRRWFAQVALCNIGRAAAAAAVPVAAALTVDYLFAPEGGALVLLAAVTTLFSLGLAGVMLARMQRRPDDRHVARFVEERAARIEGTAPLDDALVSAVDVVEQPAGVTHAAFAPIIVAGGVERLRSIHPSQIITPQSMRRAAMQAAGGAAVLLAGLLLGSPALLRAADTARVRYFPESVAVDVLPGNSRVPAGSPLRIRAVVRNAGGNITRFPPSLTVSAEGESRTVRMTPVGDAFEYAFESIDRSFSYKVSAGSAVSIDYNITALFPPRVTRIDLRYAYPSFTGLKPRDEEDGGDIYGPAGTRVRVRIHTDKPVTGARLAMARKRGAGLPLRPAGEQMVEGEILLDADDSYRVALADGDGLRSDGDTEYFIRLMDDRPPDVRILRPSSDQAITPLEEVAIEARADDDYGIAMFELVYSVAGGAERVVPFDRISGTDIQKVGSRLLAAEDLSLRPGDVIAYYARARDVGRGKRATTTRSDIFFLEVKPFSEEFVQAQSQAGGGAASAQIESLISAQKEIISATWNIERRSQGGVSAADLQQVAQAQAELRQRVEQMVTRSMRGRGRMPAPQRVELQTPSTRQPAGGDPLAAAVEAMTRAQQQLEGQRTRDAIPHEMAALNGLLQAQAEVRRREVSRQMNAGGGGGGNRSGQDLSALFDRELQRQQRTNYESRSQVEERPDRGETNDSAADRIRDLARRQEDLSRRQRDLANAGLSAEEMKRQLERLTREQTELRERAEELSRQMAQQGGQQGESGQSQSGRQGQRQGQAEGQGQQSGSPSSPGESRPGSSGLREVSEQMRNAASDLRKEDAKSAAGNAERAAEQLRRLEQQMRGRDQAAGQRGTGEIQLEAQQIAHEQRRIAAEAERLDKDGGANGEARSRLADEKERLAGRVDELQRAARQQAQKDPRAAAANGTAGAAAELERAQIGKEMRDSAKQMRGADGGEAGDPKQAGGRGDSAQREQRIARALDRVVDQLGGEGSADARRLAEQLNETRAIRDRLNTLEQQMRNAEGRQGREGPSPGRAGREGREGQGRQAGRGTGGEGAEGELQRLQQEYQRELQRSREALGRLSEAQRGADGATPEQHEFSKGAPGTEASKQDRSGWEALRKDLDLAMEKYDAAAFARLSKKPSGDRLNAGGSDRVPDRYRRQVGRYFESLARVKK